MSIRSRNFTFVVYDENVSDVLDKLNSISCTFIYIKHDKDYDNDNNLKKVHYHFIVCFENARSLDHIKSILNLSFVEAVNSLKKAVLYLIHFNNSEKTLYSPDEVLGDTELFFQYYNGSKSETADVQIIFNFLDEYDCIINMSTVTRFVIKSGLWATYRRNYSIIKDYLKDHNNFY